MPRLCYVNGRFIPHHRAQVIDIEDRGFQFADGIYEVVGWLNGKPLDKEAHLDRLQRSLDALNIHMPMARAVLSIKIDQLVKYNALHEGLVYIQVTRGAAPRNHINPSPAPQPSLIMTTKASKLWDMAKFQRGIKAISMPDLRWKRCDIKTINLVANCMARTQAFDEGAGEALLLNDAGEIIEGAASTAWLINDQGQLITHPIGSGAILPGITRESLLGLIQQTGLDLVERPFSLNEAYGANALFITAASTLMMPITMLDGKQIADGKPNPYIDALRQNYYDHLMQQQA
ncbi:MAG: D-amino-acid transaminase [Alphaproteobacteria bacterium]